MNLDENSDLIYQTKQKKKRETMWNLPYFLMFEEHWKLNFTIHAVCPVFFFSISFFRSLFSCAEKCSWIWLSYYGSLFQSKIKVFFLMFTHLFHVLTFFIPNVTVCSLNCLFLVKLSNVIFYIVFSIKLILKYGFHIFPTLSYIYSILF